MSQLRQLFGSCVPAALLAPRACGPNSRRRIFSLEVVFWAFLGQVLTPFGSCRQALRKVTALARRKAPRSQALNISADTAAYCKARQRIPLSVIDDIQQHLVERLQKNTPIRELWRGRRLKLLDGTALSMADTPQNQARWPQSGGQKKGCGFPQMNVVGLFCLASGALLQAEWDQRRVHETTLAKRLWHTLEPTDVLVADRGFCSFVHFANLLWRKVDVLMRLPEKKMRAAIGAQLPAAANFDVLIHWKRPAQRPQWMNAADFEELPASIPVRVVGCRIQRAGFRSRSLTLISTLRDGQIAAAELAALYFRRWEVELHFRELKTLLAMDVLRCLTPGMIEREVRMHFVAYNLLRCVMQQAALTWQSDIKRLSFKGALDSLRQFANALAGAEEKPRTIESMIDEMLGAIARDTLPKRPGRSEPRVLKRRRKNYRLLTKPRHEMGPLPHRNFGREILPIAALS